MNGGAYIGYSEHSKLASIPAATVLRVVLLINSYFLMVRLGRLIHSINRQLTPAI